MRILHTATHGQSSVLAVASASLAGGMSLVASSGHDGAIRLWSGVGRCWIRQRRHTLNAIPIGSSFTCRAPAVQRGAGRSPRHWLHAPVLTLADVGLGTADQKLSALNLGIAPLQFAAVRSPSRLWRGQAP